MSQTTQPNIEPSLDPKPSRANSVMLWVGRVISALPIAMMFMSAVMKLRNDPDAAQQFLKLGYSTKSMVNIGIVELVSTILYLIPQTAVFGAILLTGYLGGATASHVRLGEAFHVPVGIGVLVWLGLVLRDARLRAILPLRLDQPNDQDRNSNR